MKKLIILFLGLIPILGIGQTTDLSNRQGGGTSIDTTLIPYLAKRNVFTDLNTFQDTIKQVMNSDTLNITQNKLIHNTDQILYIPDQTIYTGTLYFGNGGDSLYDSGEDSAANFNTYLGINAGLKATRCKINTGIGYGALENNRSGFNNTAIGYNALHSGTGIDTLWISGTGGEFYANTAIGCNSQPVSLTGSYNTSVGVSSLFMLLSGHDNVGIGVHALNSNISGNSNVAIGRSSAYSCLTSYNVAIGRSSLQNAYKGINTAIGYNALKHDTSGTSNTAIGYLALLNCLSGEANTAIGHESLRQNVSGGANTSVGVQASYTCYGSYNATYGYSSGLSLTNANYNTLIGANSGKLITTGSNNITIGYNIGVSSNTGSYQLNIGDLIVGNMTGNKYLQVDGNIITKVTTTITASTTQTQGQQPLTTDINEISVCANTNDVVTMPSAAAGMRIVIINNGAETLQIFPASGDDLGAGVNTSITLAAGNNVEYVAYNAVNWEQL